MMIRNMMMFTAVMGIVFAGCSRKNEPARSGTDAETESGGYSGSATASADSQGLWLTDFEAAKVKAAAEGKDLLVDFTGSDWCYWCKKLDGEVFTKPGFVDEASKYFVFVKIDFPRDTSRQTRTLRAQNQRLERLYRVEGYPAVILMHPDGRPYAETGYREGGPDAYLAHLKELRQRR